MCGIAGVRRFEDTPITPEEISVLLCSIEHRGTHATGIALQQEDGSIQILKAPQPAWSFVASKPYDKFIEEHLQDNTLTALLHTRFATQGNPEFNENNHPLWAGNVAVVHNGGIRNDAALFRDKDLGLGDPSCETDSDVIRAILDKYDLTKKGVQMLSKMAGSAAIAAMSPAHPGEILLARSGNPIVYGFANTKFYFASELGALQRAVRPWTLNRGLWSREVSAKGLSYFQMPDHTAYLLGKEELEWRTEMRVAVNFQPSSYSTSYTGYDDKMREFRRRARAKHVEVTLQRPSPEAFRPREQGDRIHITCRKCYTPQFKRKDQVWDKLKCNNCNDSFSWVMEHKQILNLTN